MIERWSYFVAVPTDIFDDPELWRQLENDIEPDYGGDMSASKLERDNTRLKEECAMLEFQRDYQYNQACEYSRRGEQAESEQKRLLQIIAEIRQLTRLTENETDIGTAVRRLCLIWDKCDEAEGKS